MAKKSLASLMKNAPNMSKKANELLHNRFILYFVFIIAVANLFHFVFSHDLMSVCVFIVAGLLTSFFSKNMVVIMVISIVVTHVVRFGNGGHEGFKSDSTLGEQFQDALDAIDEVEKMVDEEDDEKEGFEDDEEDEEEEEEEEEEEDEEEEEAVDGFTALEGFKIRKGKRRKGKRRKGKRSVMVFSDEEKKKLRKMLNNE